MAAGSSCGLSPGAPVLWGSGEPGCLVRWWDARVPCGVVVPGCLVGVMGVVAMKLFSADLSHTTTVNSKCKYCLLLRCLSFLFTMAGPTRCPVRSTEEKPSDYGLCLSLSHQPPAFN